MSPSGRRPTRSAARRRRRTCLVVGAMLAAAVLVSCSGPARDGDEPDGTQRIDLEVDGLSRSYLLHAPEGLTSAAPLVIMLHGGKGSAEQAERAYGWPDLADRERFVVAFPDGIDGVWNGGSCCGSAVRNGVDDVAFVEAIVADVARRLPIDRTSVHVTGMSNGAILTYALACTTSGVFASYAPVAGTPLVSCEDPAPTSLLHIHGLDDATVRFDGALGSGAARIDGPAIDEVIEHWQEIDDCPPAEVTTDGPATFSRARCPGGRAVELVTVAGAGHQWPGSSGSARPVGADAPSTTLDATDLIWRFFAIHRA